MGVSILVTGENRELKCNDDEVDHEQSLANLHGLPCIVDWFTLCMNVEPFASEGTFVNVMGIIMVKIS